MKKVVIAVALVAAGLLTSRSYADVQNIRLSGDIRIRGYFLSKADDSNSTDDNFISQRTRVTCEADLEDHVLVVVTLKAEGLWGAEQGPYDAFNEQTSGAGQPNGKGMVINRGFDVGIDEAYVQLSEVFYSPATLKIGRQYLNYGRGLILSSAEQEYNFDAARLVLDYYPLTIDLVWARTVQNGSFGAGQNDNADSSDMIFANARYEMTDSVIKDVEAYVGWMSNEQNANGDITRVPPLANGSSPVILGLRSDLNLTKGLQAWVEGAYECGASGAPGGGISAGLVNVGASYTMKNVQWCPMLNANYTYATGGGDDANSQFRPWFNYQDGYNGYLLHPTLSNIHIFNVGAAVKPAKNTTLAEQVYYYLKADRDSDAFSDSNVDFGSVGPGTIGGVGSEIGWEADTILGYDYSKDVRCQLVYAAFFPDENLRTSYGFSSVAHEVRGELNVKF